MPQPSTPPHHDQPPSRFSRDQLRGWKWLASFKDRLGKASEQHPKLAALGQGKSPGGPTRLLTQEDYLSAFLFAQFNPIIDSARGFCAASHVDKVQQLVCRRPISLGSFSEAQNVFSPDLLRIVFLDLAAEHQRRAPATAAARALPPAVAIDSTLLRAVQRMDWAVWRHQGTTQRAVRLHLKLRIADNLPTDLQISAGRKCERQAFAELIAPGEVYIGDRNYSRSHALLEQLEALEDRALLPLAQMHPRAARAVALDGRERSRRRHPALQRLE